MRYDAPCDPAMKRLVKMPNELSTSAALDPSNRVFRRRARDQQLPGAIPRKAPKAATKAARVRNELTSFTRDFWSDVRTLVVC
jgi:hypothetical protein